MNYERAVSIPSGLIACRIEGSQLRIEEITPCTVDLLCDTALPKNVHLNFSFYRPESGAYCTLQTSAHKYGQTPDENAGGSVRFVFDNAACAAEIKRTLQIWSEYVNMRISGAPEDFAAKYLSYPSNTDDYCKTPEEQYKMWFSELKITKNLLSGMEIALSIDLPSLWTAYVSLPFPLFIKSYIQTKQLPDDFFSGISIERLYIGSEHCFHLFPDEKTLSAIVQKAQAEHLRLSFNTSIVHQSQMNASKHRLEMISILCPDAEIIVNDWGLLNVLQNPAYRLKPVFGTIINRFRRDARMQWKAGISEKGSLLSESALNDPLFREFALSLGVRRFEYAPGTQMLIPEGIASLHFPFYPTNTSAYCPLKAYIETGERGRQSESAGCPAYCEENAFLYPKALHMIHRMRSITVPEQRFPDEAYLRSFDRLVFNF